ncbi:hypothetical protein Pla8534_29260 [Lignipirellula cremea]|uniref:Uncharacterized protein n=1 Tax=Lignipirellula cremea TaxID=2528010 RepID=A0A518DTF8_9BACT|nr:hypothetical protein [Lignipirellula cremea]QDU95114.1 hypothetical protein Pla8534_29260 [Lignipirellula cremea]
MAQRVDRDLASTAVAKGGDQEIDRRGAGGSLLAHRLGDVEKDLVIGVVQRAEQRGQRRQGVWSPLRERFGRRIVGLVADDCNTIGDIELPRVIRYVPVFVDE